MSISGDDGIVCKVKEDFSETQKYFFEVSEKTDETGNWSFRCGTLKTLKPLRT